MLINTDLNSIYTVNRTDRINGLLQQQIVTEIFEPKPPMKMHFHTIFLF